MFDTYDSKTSSAEKRKFSLPFRKSFNRVDEEAITKSGSGVQKDEPPENNNDAGCLGIVKRFLKPLQWYHWTAMCTILIILIAGGLYLRRRRIKEEKARARSVSLLETMSHIATGDVAKPITKSSLKNKIIVGVVGLGGAWVLYSQCTRPAEVSLQRKAIAPTVLVAAVFGIEWLIARITGTSYIGKFWSWITGSKKNDDPTSRSGPSMETRKPPTKQEWENRPLKPLPSATKRHLDQLERSPFKNVAPSAKKLHPLMTDMVNLDAQEWARDPKTGAISAGVQHVRAVKVRDNARETYTHLNTIEDVVMYTPRRPQWYSGKIKNPSTLTQTEKRKVDKELRTHYSVFHQHKEDGTYDKDFNKANMDIRRTWLKPAIEAETRQLSSIDKMDRDIKTRLADEKRYRDNKYGPDVARPMPPHVRTAKYAENTRRGERRAETACAGAKTNAAGVANAMMAMKAAKKAEQDRTAREKSRSRSSSRNPSRRQPHSKSGSRKTGDRSGSTGRSSGSLLARATGLNRSYASNRKSSGNFRRVAF